MRITSVSFGYTKNLGNYESRRVDATVTIDEHENFEDALLLAQAVVYEEIGAPMQTKHLSVLNTERRRASITKEQR